MDISEQKLVDLLRELDEAKVRLAEQADLMLGVIENGPWVLIPDPRLRELVGRYVAAAVVELAGEVGADAVQAAALKVRTPILPLSVEEV
jgi:hypothetical protein